MDLRLAYFPLLLFACGTPEERAAENALYNGEAAYRAGRFELAADNYGQAATDHRVAYNLGNALYRSQLTDSAIASYRSASDTATPFVAARDHNLGSAWFRVGERADSNSKALTRTLEEMAAPGNDIGLRLRHAVMRDSLQRERARSESLIDSALSLSALSYKQSLRMDPRDEDARHDLALVQHWTASRTKQAAQDQNKNEQEKNKDLSEKAKGVMMRADSLVDRYLFGEALVLLRNALKAEPTLQQRQDYMNKLDVVTKAAGAK